SVVVAAGSGSDEALAWLFNCYRKPAIAFLRSLGESPENAEDLFQSFVAQRLVNRQLFQRASADHGTFRSWMKQSLRHFRLNKWREASAQRRGGQTCHIPMEASGAHGAGDDIQSVASDFADQSFDRAYAGEIVSRALTRLAEEYASL